MDKSAKKSLGQHWLNDQSVLDDICDLAQAKVGDVILEIGPGHGSLTRTLLEAGAEVTAVELDNDLAEKLPDELPDKRLTVVHGDILKFNLTSLPAGYKVVANIPYYLTSNLIRTLSESVNPPSSMTLLVQKEVAERICAEPGEMSLLSVSAQIYHKCTLGPLVTADKFSPPPKVDSQIVHMERLAGTLPKNRKHFFRIVKAGFSSRRKTLENSLSGGLRTAKGILRKHLEEADIEPSRRPQELSIAEWKRLAELIPPARLE